MPVMQQVAKDAPLMIAWEAYKATEDYANTKRWATKPEHTEGSLWAAFMAGFNAPKPAGVEDAMEREINAIIIGLINDAHSLPLGHSHAAMQTKAREAIFSAFAALLNTPTTRIEITEEVKAAIAMLEELPQLPSSFQWVGTDRAEDLFDAENRHKNGSKPVDYLRSWLSMLRPFAFATKDDSWGEMEKLLCTTLRNHVQTLDAATRARAALTAALSGDAG